jgi:hypothetical protein
VNARRAAHGWTWPVGLATAAGALLLVWTVRSAGSDAVWAGVRKLGTGFLVVLVLGGLRQWCRAAAWRFAVDPADRLTLRNAFVAVLAGDALGNITPFGSLISEPSKILLVSRALAARSAIAALAIENIFYSASAVLMLASGTVALLWSFDVRGLLRMATLATLAGTIVLALVATWALLSRQRFVSAVMAELMQWSVARPHLATTYAHVVDIEERVYGFAEGHSDRLLPIAALEIAYQAAAVTEIWIVVRLMTDMPPPVLTAFVLEYVNRAITIAFQFVPLWLGVDEAGTGAAAGALGLGSATGIGLALVRKARIAVWTSIGIALLLRRGLSLRATAAQAELVALDR